MTKNYKIILGVDPGSLTTGFGLIKIFDSQKPLHLAHGVIKLDSQKNIEARISDLSKDFSQILTNYKPDIAVLEDVFSYKHPRSALILGQARGAILSVLGLFDVPVKSLTPTQIKSIICGKGRAQKFQVSRIASLELGIKEPSKIDAADALATALAFYFSSIR